MSIFGSGSGYQGTPRRGINMRLIIGVVIALVGVIGYFSHTSVNPTTGEKQHVSMTSDQETQLGLQAAPEMAQQMGGEADPSDPAAREVRAVGETVWHKSTAEKSPYQYQYHLLNDPKTINAFALPGGQIFITRALYDRLKDEAELAGVLGHETGHVVERHSAQQMEKQKLGQAWVIGTGVATSDHGNRGAMLAQVASQMIMLKYGRGDESQADACGLRFMTEAGYDPRAMIDVMKILQEASSGNRQPEFLSTHPDPGNRIEAIEQWLKDHPDRASSLTRGNELPHSGNGSVNQNGSGKDTW
jgi:predicted Zn-dependent protease